MSNFRNLCSFKETPYFWNGYYFEPLILFNNQAINDLFRIVNAAGATSITQDRIEEFVKTWVVIYSTMGGPEAPEPIPGVFACESGTLQLDFENFDIYKTKYLGFNPDCFVTQCIQAQFDPDANDPAVDEYFASLAGECDMVDIDDISGKSATQLRIEEILGLSIHEGSMFRASPVLLGPPRCGKSIFLDLLTDFIGRKECFPTSFHVLGPFQNCQLADRNHGYHR